MVAAGVTVDRPEEIAKNKAIGLQKQNNKEARREEKKRQKELLSSSKEDSLSSDDESDYGEPPLD